MRPLASIVILLFAAVACRNERTVAASALSIEPRRELRIATARDLTSLYAASALGEWNVNATAAGPDCTILFVQTPVTMERTMVDAMHYGLGSYRVSETSIDQLYRARSFRGVLYKDGSRRLWAYGDVAEGVPQPCD
ncbi:MAG TPA: hypothetical protein VEU30_14835 [Thermoanaerobaculia bacterium]|nr:hypothetical protein [Thermoanaerobaculia bacterium]